MTDRSDLRGRLVIGRKGDGRRQYDEGAREELVRLCLRPGVSVARTAIEHDVNPNLLRKWIGLYQQRQRAQRAGDATVMDSLPTDRSVSTVPATSLPVALPAFIPVVTAPTTVSPPAASPPLAIALQVRLPNGVELDLGEANVAQFATIVQVLGEIRCSASTPR